MSDNQSLRSSLIAILASSADRPERTVDDIIELFCGKKELASKECLETTHDIIDEELEEYDSEYCEDLKISNCKCGAYGINKQGKLTIYYDCIC